MKRFIARQPIFDTKMNVVAYELLFRTDLDNYAKSVDVEAMSSSVIHDSMLLFDIHQLTDGRGAFINVDTRALMGGYVSLLPPDLTTVEILETVVATDDVVAAATTLKREGYRLALDDFIDNPSMDPLVAIADCLKIDVLATDMVEVAEIVYRRRRKGLKLLAEKVENQEMYERCIDMGFELFQGYFFERPVVLTTQEVSGSKMNYLRLLKEVHDGGFSLDRIEQITKQDVSISYKLLRYMNSAGFGLRNRVSSIREALFLLGEENIRKLVTLWAVAGMGMDGPSELVVRSVARARLCEAIAPLSHIKTTRSEAFLLGVLSLIDVIVGQPIADVVSHLPLSDAVQAALVDRTGPLRPLLDCVLAYEKGGWEDFSARASELGVDEEAFPALYEEALAGTAELVGSGPAK